MLSLFFAASPAIAQQASPTPAAPVTISACRGGIASLELIELAAYDVTLRNTANLTTDVIRLRIDYGRGKTLTFDIKGTFSPNTDVKRRLSRTLGFGLYSYSSTANRCSVQYVHYINGSSWNQSNP